MAPTNSTSSLPLTSTKLLQITSDFSWTSIPYVLTLIIVFVAGLAISETLFTLKLAKYFLAYERAYKLTTLRPDPDVPSNTECGSLETPNTPDKRTKDEISRLPIERVIHATVCREILTALFVSCAGIILVWWKNDVQRDTLVQWVMFLLKEREKKA